MGKLAAVDSTRLKRRLAELLVIVGGNGRALIRTEMSHLIEDLANATTKPNKQPLRIARDYRAAFRPSRTGAGTPDLKELYRVLDARGRGGRRVPTVGRAIFVRRALAKQHIGFLAHGWYGGGNPTHARVPAAAARQPVQGTFRVIDTPTHFILTSTNQVRFARHMRGLTIIIQKAVNKRAGSIKRNAALIKAGVKKYQYRG